MAVVLYQRAEPRQKTWLPLLSQQIRLRNVTQILLINPAREEEVLYFTLHVSPMSAPFYTSEKVLGTKVTVWKEIPLPLCSTRLSATGCILRVWTGQGEYLFSWGVRFLGLQYLGVKDEWNPKDFRDNSILFSTPYGSFSSLDSVVTHPVGPQRFLQIRTTSDNTRNSYTLKSLVALHRLQRSLLEEFEIGQKLKMDMGVHGYKASVKGVEGRQNLLLSDRLLQRAKLGQGKLRLKEEIETVKLKVSSLLEEKGRAEGRVTRLKKEASHVEEISTDLVNRIYNFSNERVNLKDTKADLASKGQHLSKLRGRVFLRKKQLISELLQIYPLALVEGSKRYSINGVQLPNAEDYGTEGGGQVSVALGYAAHLVAMLSFFLDIPSRYSIRHFGSRSRIIDHITIQIPDKEREFPLYFKGKRDVYCAYAVYLLNKNVGQLRWYCAMSTPDLRATLPNLVELIGSRLVIPGWPPNLAEALEIAQEITEVDSNFLENDTARSLDQGLDKILGTETEVVGETYLKARRDSFSENPGGNSTALGEIQYGRGQERFLSGWKKKTYVETDDFDPKWLLDSMNLDFDTGRRFSISNSTHPSKPVIIVPEDKQQVSSRRRRIGQVEPPALSNLEESNLDQKPESGTLPSKDIVQLEKQIKEFERRKSRVSNSPPPPQMVSENPQSVQTSPTNSSWVTNVTTLLESENDNTQTHNLPLAGSEFGLGKSSEVCDSSYHIPPPSTVEGLQADIKDIDSFENSMCIEASPSIDEKGEDETKCKEETKDIVDLVDCDSGSRDQNGADSALWIRTEALLGAQSFNLVRRRMSEST